MLDVDVEVEPAVFPSGDGALHLRRTGIDLFRPVVPFALSLGIPRLTRRLNGDARNLPRLLVFDHRSNQGELR